MKKIIILISLILFLVMGIVVYSQEPSPTPLVSAQIQPPVSPPQKGESKHMEDKSKNHQQDLDELLSAEKISTPEKTKTNGTGDKNKHDNETDTNLWIMRATIVLAIVAFFQLITMFFQYKIMDKTDETSRLRDRAFVYFSTPTFTPYPSKESPKEYIFKIIARNTGNMPAKNIDIRYAAIYNKTKTDIAPIKQAEWVKVNTPKALGPKEDFLFQLFKAKEIYPDEFGEMKKNNSTFKFILAKITYFDGFSNEQRVTKMGVRLNVDGSGATSFTYTENHNCTDNDCQKQ